MTLTRKNLLILGAGFLLVVLTFSFVQQTRADITSDVATVTPNTFRYYRFFATSTAQTNFATSTNATSTNIAQWMDGNGRVDNGYFVIAGAKSVEVAFGRSATTSSAHNAGTSTYNVQITSKVNPSESDWYDFENLVDATTTSATPTGSQFETITAATTTIRYGMNLDYQTAYAMRCVVRIAADGQNTCVAAARF